MKKNGFTLAEVLITLAIIGVVATLTLPALLTNTGEQQAKTALKKGINTLTEAAQMNNAIAGFDYSSLKSVDTKSDEEQSLYALLSSRASIDYTKSGAGSDGKATVSAVDATGDNYVIFFRDGSALSFKASDTTVSNDDAMKIQDDNLVYGIPVLFDTNGAKGPNLVSNCKGEATMSLGKKTSGDTMTTNDVKDETDITKCTKSNRVIKDQFGLRLRGSIVVPNGAAARWAFEN